MSEVIILSDSNESDSLMNTPINEKIGNSQQDSVSDEFDFPEVQFDYISNKNNITDTNKPCQRQYDINNSKSLNVISNVETSNEIFTSAFSRKRFYTHDMSDSFESDQYEKNIYTSQQLIKEPIKKSKNKLKEERLKRQENLIKEKTLKAITAKKLKNIRPGECMKFMKVILDKYIKEYNFYPEILVTLKDTNVSYNFISQLIPKSITWERSIEKDSIDENNKIYTEINKQTEKYIIVIWNWNEVVEKLMDDSFCTSISYIRTLLPDYNMTLVIFGIQEYFLYYKKKNKLKNNKGSGSKSSNETKDFKIYKESPEISKQQLEVCLAEIQIINKCNSRLIENAADLALMIYQYTKAIAEIPYKLEKKQHFDKEYNWYIAGDNKDTVRVDKDGNGLKRLWQQQLCQFNLSSLEIAEAICSVYKSPAQLVEAYMNCTSADGSKLLKDLPIRRAVGPLTTTRRVGPELSKKVHIMFTSENGDVFLGNND
ncbi:hypothetical protein HZH66_001307 [Vespula vulgaris]|uniref:Crossover junction endonuclease EME1 n=1 Tax=Vespula vulgaris TaxID=7454 RepID=A0A834KYG6_VESVU|nr:crossover junction endonuclease EME1 [Vespula vulgaris]XP_050856724.1 crossover junction endonuclease EME1 [Vespula vulgaris]KAF7412411.1 hypothetical protein HZH66_001307 [Vespula vulgaris]